MTMQLTRCMVMGRMTVSVLTLVQEVFAPQIVQHFQVY